MATPSLEEPTYPSPPSGSLSPGPSRGLWRLSEVAYRCTRCKKTVEVDYEYSGIRCPYCGHRILMKERPTTVKRMKAV